LFTAVAAHAAGYTVSSTSVTSTTVPVTVLPQNTATTTWILCVRSGAAVPVLCFPYKGTVPSSPPAGALEITGANCRGDGTVYDTVLQTGWACVLESAGTAATVDAVSR
jgi:hypothetical protein